MLTTREDMRATRLTCVFNVAHCSFSRVCSFNAWERTSSVASSFPNSEAAVEESVALVGGEEEVSGGNDDDDGLGEEEEG